jgi:hypothetical protein
MLPTLRRLGGELQAAIDPASGWSWALTPIELVLVTPFYQFHTLAQVGPETWKRIHFSANFSFFQVGRKFDTICSDFACLLNPSTSR